MLNEDTKLKNSNYELNQELLAYFLKYLLEDSDKSEATILNIMRDLEIFLVFLFENNDAMIQYKNIIHFLDYIEEKYKESSYISKASSLRQFINWLNLENNPFWKIKISVSYEDFKFYSIDEIFPDIASEAKQSPEQSYKELILRSLYELYLSIDELLDLKVSDYNLASEKIQIRKIEYKVSKELAGLLRFHLKEYRDPNSLSLYDPLFINKFGTDLKRLDIINILKERDLKNIYLKRSRIIHLLEESKSQSEIESLLGIKLSKFYSPFIKQKDYRLLSAYNEFHPRAN